MDFLLILCARVYTNIVDSSKERLFDTEKRKESIAIAHEAYRVVVQQGAIYTRYSFVLELINIKISLLSSSNNLRLL